MIRNYVTVALRNIFKYKTFSAINIFGLALAMSVCLLVILMLADQRRYDQFNTKKDRIYRVRTHNYGGRNAYATSPYPVGTYLKSNYPAVEDAVTLLPGVTGDVYNGEKYSVMKGYFTDPSFFRIFDYQLTDGDKETSLGAPRSIVISKELAQQLFGSEEAVGKTVDFFDRKLPFPIEHSTNGSAPVSWGSFTVTGVFDASKYKSHLKFDVLMSSSTITALADSKLIEDLSNNWNWFFRPYNFVLMSDGKNAGDLNDVLADVMKRNEKNIQEEYSKGMMLTGQSLTDIQLGLSGNDTNNRLPIQGYYFLGILVIITMLMACLNYTNLSIARALTRAKEIGIRKVTGASKRSLVFQFLGESVIVSLIALVIAIIFLQAIRPAFMGLWLNKFLAFELPFDPLTYTMFAGFAVLIGLLAGLYPAFRMSGYQPITALKKQEGNRTSKFGLRKVLSVSQFSISLLFITTSILIFNQFKHYMSFDYGMETENIVNVNLQGIDYRKASAAFSQVPGVVGVSASDLIPAAGTNNSTDVRKPGETEYKSAGVIYGDENFIGNLGLGLVAGKNVVASNDTLSSQVIVNEEMARAFGYQQPSQIVGEAFENKWDKQPMVVVGVVKDFRFQLLINTSQIGPLIIFIRPNNFQYMNVKISTNNIPALTAGLMATWKTLDPVHPMQYEFYDDALASTHQAIFDIVTILGSISFLAVVIACLGLLGMATYMAERRKKEVGIRKVLGAAEWGIVILLSKTFLNILAIAVMIGAPLSYFISRFWLELLPNRVDFGFGTVAIATSVLLLLGFITIASQTIRASKLNAAETLKED